MKKTLVKIILALVILALPLSLFCACGNNVSVSKEDIMAANSTKKLIEKYGSFYFSDKSGSYLNYVDAEVAYYCDGAYHEVTHGGIQYGADDSGNFVNFYAGPEMFAADMESMTFSTELFPLEKVVSTKKKGKTITLTTEMTVAKLNELGYDYPESMVKDGCYTIEYVLDAETLELLTRKETVTWSGGNMSNERNMTMTYGAERPKKADELISDWSKGEKITVTAIVMPGTAEEKTYTSECLKGGYAWFFVDENCSVYTDAECKNTLPAYTKINEDVTYYIGKSTE